ncbi:MULTISPECIES: hypothetical protein [Clostridium]|nr:MULTISPECIES: hypothetical protein [Clostridium]
MLVNVLLKDHILVTIKDIANYEPNGIRLIRDSKITSTYII